MYIHVHLSKIITVLQVTVLLCPPIYQLYATLTSYPGLHPDFISAYLHGCEIKSGWRPGYEVMLPSCLPCPQRFPAVNHCQHDSPPPHQTIAAGQPAKTCTTCRTTGQENWINKLSFSKHHKQMHNFPSSEVLLWVAPKYYYDCRQTKAAAKRCSHPRLQNENSSQGYNHSTVARASHASDDQTGMLHLTLAGSAQQIVECPQQPWGEMGYVSAAVVPFPVSMSQLL